MSAPTQISPQWTVQVFRDRGIKPPAILSIQRFLAALSEQERGDVYAALHKIEMGVDDPAITRAIVERMEANGQQAVAGAAQSLETRSAQAAVKQVVQAMPKQSKPAGGAVPWYRAHGAHIYATSAAMKVELDILKSDPDEPLRYTVQIEMAPSRAPRTFDWDAKIAFQFTRRELPMLAAMLMGYMKKPLALSNHGPDRDKSIEIQDRGTNRLLVRLRQGGRRVLMPVFAEDVHMWLTIAMQALKHNSPELDGALLLEMLKRTAAIHDATEEGA